MNPIESGQSELIRINSNFHSEWIWSIRIHPIFQSEWIQWIRSIRMIPKYSVSFELILINMECARINSDWKFRLILINSVSYFSIRFSPGSIQNQSEWIRLNPVNPNPSDLSTWMNQVNPNNSNFQSQWIQSIRLIRMIPKYSVSFGLILINSDWPDSFGLILNGPRVDLNWKISSD